MPNGLKRYQNTRQFHFITFSCYSRQPFLHSAESKDTLQRLLEETRSRYRLYLAAYVFMPEHVHLLTDEPATSTLATFLQVFKQTASRHLKLAGAKPTDQFWQRRYYDFNVSSHEKYIEKIQYIHRNPVVRGLVANPADYHWSSYNHYATGEPGPIQIESDWTARRREQIAPAITPSP